MAISDLTRRIFFSKIGFLIYWIVLAGTPAALALIWWKGEGRTWEYWGFLLVLALIWAYATGLGMWRFFVLPRIKNLGAIREE